MKKIRHEPASGARRRSLLLAVAALVVFAEFAYSQEAHDWWTLRADGKVFFALELSHENIWSGQLSMPSRFEIGPGGKSFTHVSAPTVTERLKDIRVRSNTLSFVTDDGQQWEFTVSPAGDTAQLKMIGPPLDPWVLRRGQEQPVARDWSPGETYSLEDEAVSSTEMLRLYEADQKDRTPGGWTPQRWSDLAKADQARRKQARHLLNTGKLRTAEDFVRAAFVFQHGTTKEDFLLAHTLALAALARGDKAAAWIAAATLDAYLQAVGQSQIFGTRFVIQSGKAMPKPSFDPDMIPQQLREQVGVPSLQVGAEQFLKANQ